MKKLFLSFIATFLVTFITYAQPSKEDVRLELARGMVSFVDGVKGGYRAGQSYADFQRVICGTWRPTPEGDALLRKGYDYIVKGTTNSTIMTTYDGKEMAAAFYYIHTHRNSDGSELFGGAPGQTNEYATTSSRECKWYQVGCHLANLWDWLTANDNANLNTIISIIQHAMNFGLIK